MFWIFGGYFQSGNNAWWAYGADNYIERDVILVQPNHRLGPFGFTDMGECLASDWSVVLYTGL